MKGITLDIDAPELFIGDLLFRLVVMLVKHSFNMQSRFGRGMSDKLQDDFIGNERLGSPVDGDEIEHLVFNGVPLAGARRVVTDMDYEPRSSGKLLQAVLPELVPGSIAGT